MSHVDIVTPIKLGAEFRPEYWQGLEENAAWIASVQIERRGNYGEACNRGLCKGSAPWVLYLGSDAYIPGGFLKNLVGKAPDWASVVYGDSMLHGLFETRLFASSWNYDKFLQGNYVDGQSPIRREVALKYRITEDPDLMRINDYHLWLRMARDGIQGWYNPDVYFEHWIRPDSANAKEEGYEEAAQAVREDLGI